MNFQLESKDGGVTIVRFDVAGESVNTLKVDFAEEFGTLLEKLEADPDTRAIVVASAKKNSFIAGADIGMLASATTVDDGVRISQQAQEAMDRIESFSKPIVAAVHGTCLGGGLEFALACHDRICSDHKSTRLGLPEVQLGVLPGAGGTQRLPELIGAQQALDLLLTGRQVDARKAKRLGLCSEVVAPAIVEQVAVEKATELADKPRSKKTSGLRAWIDRLDSDELQQMALEDNPVGRKVLFDQARKHLLKKTRGNYPAPEKILDVVKAGLQRGRKAGLQAEREAFGQLLHTPQAKELMQIFFATQALKKDSGVDSDTAPAAVDRVAVIGAGLMGSGIAYVTIDKTGAHVRLKDRDLKSAGQGLAAVRKIVDDRVKKRRCTPYDADRMMSRVTASADYRSFEYMDVVIEAVFEDLALKHQILKDVETYGDESTIFASNTSSLPITKIADAAARPENVIGMHYFSPVEKMPLLEVIVTPKTSDLVTATCVKLGKDQGKTVIVVNDGVGFYTTRILAPFMNEAAYLVSEGQAVDHIDKALMDFGFPIGPLKLTDEVGIDVGAKVGAIMQEAFGDRMQPPQGFERLVADDRKGRKNERGFYEYGADATKGAVDESVYDVLGIKPERSANAHEMAERCTLQMVGEAVRCLEEGVLRSPRDGDIGAIFGLGFPPFLGGPFRYIDALGAKAVVEKMQALQRRHGGRFAPCQLLIEHAKSGKSFHASTAKKSTARNQTAPQAAV